MGRYKGRSSVACHACHSHKLKCSGESPCQRCRARGRECAYPSRDRLLTVPESYLRGLEAQASICRPENSSSQSSPQPSRQETSRQESRDDRLLEDCSPELFVQKLRELSVSASPPASPSARHSYSRLNFDFLQPHVSLKLPPQPYVLHLLDVFEEGYRDYHWYLRGRFRARLALTYADPDTQAADRNWLCRVSVMLALAEAWNYGRARPEGLVATPSDSTAAPFGQPLPPGSSLFEQALLLLGPPSEEPVLEDVEALNLIAFYCYSLNRRNTAYLYAGQSLRLATLLRLHRQGPEDDDDANDSVDREHRIRVWWTSYCMDLMVSTELGLPTVYESLAAQSPPPLPSDDRHGHAGEFFEAPILAAQIRLCQIKSRVVDTVTREFRRRDPRPFASIVEPCMELLREWRANLPDNMSFSFDRFPAGLLGLPFGRVLASLYLRYHQCFILLLRPVFLQELASAYANPGADSEAPPDVVSLKLECVRAAQCNCRILVNLGDSGKIARFGYWESLHLFSGLAMLSLSRIPASASSPLPDGDPSPVDIDLYARARSLLEEMAQSGNHAARGHRKLLADVEDMVDKVLRGGREGGMEASSETAGPLDSGAGLPSDFFDDLANQQAWNVVDWENILGEWPA